MSVERWTPEQINAKFEEIARAKAATEPDHDSRCGTAKLRADGGDADDVVVPFVGDHVTDREDDDEKTMVVTETTSYRADEFRLEGTEKTVADVNDPQYANDPVVNVVYPDRTDSTIHPLKEYAFPAGRLEITASVHTRDGGEE